MENRAFYGHFGPTFFIDTPPFLTVFDMFVPIFSRAVFLVYLGKGANLVFFCLQPCFVAIPEHPPFFPVFPCFSLIFRVFRPVFLVYLGKGANLVFFVCNPVLWPFRSTPLFFRFFPVFWSFFVRLCILDLWFYTPPFLWFFEVF